MKDNLAKLFERLETEGASVMPEIYALTSPHLFGIIKNIISDAASAQHVLKSVYARVWAQRHVLRERHKGEPLTYMRRLAHRSAMDFKFKSNIESKLQSAFLAVTDINSVEAKALDGAEQDMRILRLAYLKGASISDISDFEKLDINQIKVSLEKAVGRLRGDAS